MTSVLLITGDAAEDLEVMYPYQRLLEEGYEVHVAAPTVKKLQFVVHDFVDGFDTYTEKAGHTWPADIALADVDPSRYAALVLPGGRAPEYLRGNAECRRVVKHFVDANKPIAALCHGPLILIAVGALSGRSSSAYPALAPDLNAVGAQWEDSPAHVDGNIVTGRAWPDHPLWMRAFMEVLRTKAPAPAQ
ncbi:DJ-1/PfpI family protein [Nocardia sp. NPDC004278]